jgi:hypothetical protein
MMYFYETPAEDTKLVDGLGPWYARKLWCRKHCSRRWEYPGFGRFTFWNEYDYLLFLLRWS